MSDAGAIFIPDGDRFVPTVLSGSPWADDMVHGGPVNGLLARAVQTFAGEPGMHVSRLTIDLFRPVPKRPLAVSVRSLRAGRRIHVVEALLLDGDVEVSHASAVLLRKSEVPGLARHAQAMPPVPDELPTTGLGRTPRPEPGGRMGFHTTVQARWVSRAEDPPPAVVWMHVPVPLVAGEETSPLVALASVADFTNPLSSRGAGPGAGFINVDCTIYLHREPEGDWFCLETARAAEPTGVGVAHATLYDRTGAVGNSTAAALANEVRR